MKKSILLILLLHATAAVFAQPACKDVLNRSDKLYQEGQIQLAVETLESCIFSLSSRDERMEAYRLLGICYSFLNNKEKSLYYIKQMLKVQPDYQKYPNIDPVEFTSLVSKFNVRDIVFAGVSSGLTISSVRSSKSYALYESPQRYLPTYGYQLSGFGEYYLWPFLSFTLDAGVSVSGFTHQIDSAGGTQQQYKELQQYFTLNTGARYYQKIGKKLSVYAAVEGGIHYMIAARGNLQSQEESSSQIHQATKDALPEREHLQPFMMFRLGVTIPTGKGSVAIDGGFGYFFRNLVNPDERMSDIDFIYTNQYVNDDVSLNMALLRLTYKMPIFRNITIKEN